MNLIDGRKVATELQAEMKREIEQLKSEQNIIPGLATILAGNELASRIYVSMKKKACESIGIYHEEHAFPEDVGEDEVIQLIRQLNDASKIHGILVQLPLPSHLNERKILKTIFPKKDVDGFHPTNMGNLMIGVDMGTLVPCTPAGIMTLLEEAGVSIEGKHAVIVGRSDIVGKPVALMLLAKHATVTICHSKTRNLSEYTRQADILVAATGKAKLITEDMVKEGAVVIDVGINRIDGKLCGDVDFEAVKRKVSAITPVPGGVGPMTIAMLMRNTITAAKSALS
ncbi:MAG: bifunctional methylenetetrahydrofolate dehydrogenase/methenyltetrahydrofolate cyclohydrolase FolD [Methanosarcinales archaeon Met12]|nr:MAG: bifunctional methylenetetrahydrofolate dehydrogenase/methenyltetrahydrofolate cyclohydrolase FolD [Methanosarcinales archaeon Met12]